MVKTNRVWVWISDLKDNPMSFLGSDVHSFLGDDLLTLAQWDVVEVVAVGREAKLIAEFLDVFERIDARRQNEEDWSRWTWLLIGLGELDASTFDILRAQLLLHECPATHTPQPTSAGLNISHNCLFLDFYVLHNRTFHFNFSHFISV